MATFVGPVNYCEIITYGHAVARGGDAKKIQGVFHFRRTDSIHPISEANIAAEFDSAIMGPILNFLSVDYAQERTTIRFFEDADHAPVSFVETGVGAVAANRESSFAAAVLVLHSLQRGPYGIGKKYLGPIADSLILGDTLTAPGVTLLTAAGAAILAGFTDSNGNVWRSGLKGGTRKWVATGAQYRTNPTTTVWHDFTSVVVNKSVVPMRRRRIRTVV